MISIIVPVYNVEPYLRECIESILAQTYTDWELILSDDGSTDNSGRICDDYAARDSRIRVIHAPNAGLSEARNRGLDICRGSHITFVDSDDYIHIRYLEILSSVEADIVSCRPTRSTFDVYDAPVEIYTDTEDILLDALYQQKINISACGKLYRRYLFDNLRYTRGIYYEDLDIFPRIIMNLTGALAIVPSELYFYRNTPGSIINTWSDKRLDVLAVTESIEKTFVVRSRLSGAARSRRFSANFNMFLLALRHKRYDVATKCFEYIKCTRKAILADRRVRIKNKAGALLSYLGCDFFKIICRL